MKETITFATIVGIILTMSMLMIHSLGESDAIECQKWAKEAQQYPAYYITSWQKAQCDYWSTPINAPVK